MSYLLAFFRFLFFVAFTFVYFWYYMITDLLVRGGMKRGMKIRRRWCHVMTWVLGISVHRRGTPPDFPCLLVCNHRSYLDPVLILEDIYALPAGKSEIRSWPIIGYAAHKTGAIFIERANPENRRKVQQRMATLIKQTGFPVINYAEGTTHAQATTSAFKKGAFIMAAENQLPIIPVALDYLHLQTDAFLVDDVFVPHFFRTFRKWKTPIKLNYGKKITQTSIEETVQQTQEWIDQELVKFREEWELEDKG